MKRMFAVIFAAVPFAFGLIRAFETGGCDVRYIWVAGAAFVGAGFAFCFAAASLLHALRGR